MEKIDTFDLETFFYTYKRARACVKERNCMHVCVCVCVRARACVRAYLCVPNKRRCTLSREELGHLRLLAHFGLLVHLEGLLLRTTRILVTSWTHRRATYKSPWTLRATWKDCLDT